MIMKRFSLLLLFLALITNIRLFAQEGCYSGTRSQGIAEMNLKK